MRTIVKGKNYEVPDRVRRYAERKLARLQRLLDDRSDVIVELAVEGHRSVADSHLVDVTLVVEGRTIRGRGAAATHEAGIDQVVDKVERRAVDFREKPRSRTKSGVGQAAAAIPEERSSAADAGGKADEEGARILRLKRFAIEPMFTEDAIARMEELGHAFFVFADAETERIAILYRRRAGGYGVIEPALGGGYTSRGGAGGSGGSGSRRTRR